MRILKTFAIGASLLWSFAAVQAQCPAVNLAPGCNAIITIAANGTYSVTGVAANGTNYDGSDDALFGIVNNSSTAVTSVTLNGNGVDIFGFDGDGIDTFGVPGNSTDTTGYGGPNAYYTNISPDATMGTVDFLTPVAANGGTSFFSLEESFDAATPPSPGPGMAATPEPSSLLLLGTGVLSCAGMMRRRLLQR